MNRKEKPCTVCGSWNAVGLDTCPTCGTSLIEVEVTPKPAKSHYTETGVDRFFDRWSKTENPFLRALYMLAKGIWLVYMAIVGFILWLIAAMPG